MAGTSDVDNVENVERQPRTKRVGSRDIMVDLNARLAKVELAVGEGQDKFDELDRRIDELDEGKDELREGVQGALNEAISNFQTMVKAMEDTFEARYVSLEAELAKVVTELNETRDELVLCKKAIAQGDIAGSTKVVSSGRVDVPKPKVFKGSRNAKELDNFLWSLERYFKALGVEDENKRVDSAALYLEDTAMVWWRRRFRPPKTLIRP